ncbi:hypothetical protein PR202_gb17285 [Eleusine coracana subsp. coracana]|uniref:Fructose-bisphosphate aldolase n=1 Tax=Eleusine coracana subsp. coracana TaxID=191504 RepID=A0AAV5F379_ELECO|nr:hypothetical protein PR202_gb17285 [Eleusine coracana subsp. coracana]
MTAGGRSMVCCAVALLAAMVLLSAPGITEAYDSLDPNGNITIKWDIMHWTPDGYAVVTMYNYQQFRHIGAPGWQLGWTWARKEVIWKSPTIVDLLPGTPYNMQITNCCKAGVISTIDQDPANAASSFQISVGLAGTSTKTVKPPKKFTLKTPDDTAMLWGEQFRNDLLMKAGKHGNVQGEIRFLTRSASIQIHNSGFLVRLWPHSLAHFDRLLRSALGRRQREQSTRAGAMSSAAAASVAFIGAHDLSSRLAASFLRSGARVRCFAAEVCLSSPWWPFRSRLLPPCGACKLSRMISIQMVSVQADQSAAAPAELGDVRCATPAEAATDAALVLVLSDADGIDELFFGVDGIVKGLCAGAVVLVQSTLLPSQLEKLEQKLTGEKKNVFLLDGYIFSDLSDELKQHIVVVASGRQDIAERARQFFHGKSKEAHFCLDKTIYFAEGEIGTSRIFVELVPKLLSDDPLFTNFLYSSRKNASRVMDMAKAVTFPLPLLAVAYQQLIHGSSAVTGVESASPLKVWEEAFGVNIIDAASQQIYDASKLADHLVMESKTAKRIGFIGLGAMGFGMASHLLKSGFSVVAYDVYKPTMARFADLGGSTEDSPEEVAKDVEILIIMVANEFQADNVLYGNAGAVPVLPAGTSVILSSTVSPGFVACLNKKLEAECREIKLVDAPVSGGVKRAAEGTLTIIASGTDEALRCTGAVLSGSASGLGRCDDAAVVKVYETLTGVKVEGTPTMLSKEDILHSLPAEWSEDPMDDVVSIASRSSTNILVVLDDDPTGTQTVHDIEVLTEWPVEALVEQFLKLPTCFFILTNSRSMTADKEADAAISVLGEMDAWIICPFFLQGGRYTINDIHYVADSDRLIPAGETEFAKDASFGYKSSNLRQGIVSFESSNSRIPVHVSSIAHQLFISGCPSIRSASGWGRCDDAAVVKVYETLTGVKVEGTPTMLSKEDVLHSLPAEWSEDPMDDVVSIASRSSTNILVVLDDDPTGTQTVHDIEVLTEWPVEALVEQFLKLPTCFFILTNSRSMTADKEADAAISVLGEMDAWIICPFFLQGGRYTINDIHYVADSDRLIPAGETEFAKDASFWLQIFQSQTAASFVSARIGIKPKPPICPNDLGLKRSLTGGLIIVGSYVPKTTKQVDELRSQCGESLRVIEVSVDMVSMRSTKDRDQEISRVVQLGNAYIQSRKDTLVLTSRQLITGKAPEESLEINCKVSSALVEIVRRIKSRPRYIIAKGGITSSDIATKALEARRAKVMGQALAGVPLWQLGPESRLPGVPYIVFPVDYFLFAKNAEKGGYAVGAFNVYNLEGIEAVVAAAEAEKSPAILQVHPSALKQGGVPLVACCIAAAEQSCVPITVHYDHGTSKSDLLEALEMGFDSVMVDGSHLALGENILYTKSIASLAHVKDILVEAELGRLSGTEDGLTVEEYEAKFTDVAQADGFIDETSIDALAVCIGNVHGKYPPSGPNLRFDLLKDLRALTLKKGVTLVLHGASGLPHELIKECIELGVRKFNVNTEVRNSYLESLKKPEKDLIQVMASAKEAMKAVVVEKIRLFGSAGKA